MSPIVDQTDHSSFQIIITIHRPLYLLFRESNSYNTVGTPKGVSLSLSMSTLMNLASYCRQHTIHPLNAVDGGGGG